MTSPAAACQLVREVDSFLYALCRTYMTAAPICDRSFSAHICPSIIYTWYIHVHVCIIHCSLPMHVNLKKTRWDGASRIFCLFFFFLISIFSVPPGTTSGQYSTYVMYCPEWELAAAYGHGHPGVWY